MINQGKVSILGVEVDVVDYDAAVTKIIDAAREKIPYGVSALAVHGIMTGALNPEHRTRLNALELVTPDGQPVRWAMRFLHHRRLPDRVYGPSLTLKVCDAAEKSQLSIYLYGSRKEVLDRMVFNLRLMFPRLSISGYEASKFRQLSQTENEQMVKRIRDSGANIVLVGLGCPRQEVFVYENKKQLEMPVLAVGAAFDFHAGLLRQAPPWMQRLGLEWVYRLTQEPRRLWKRYLYLNPLYLWMLLLQKAGLPKETASGGSPEELRYG